VRRRRSGTSTSGWRYARRRLESSKILDDSGSVKQIVELFRGRGVDPPLDGLGQRTEPPAQDPLQRLTLAFKFTFNLAARLKGLR